MDNEKGLDEIMKEFWEKQAEERRMQEAEIQIRYAERKRRKEEYRARIERATVQICDIVENAAQNPCKAEDIAALAAALNHMATALHAAEGYAESRPYGTLGGFCAV